ncbi:hypothetical protein MC7420_2331 [Coleofasciculus chthonoplastes PCC 7420]|uniref:Uncharacterized protein n=1 Tax=Coleofasciculus chthonoplastes PCC 7420 TaxID=118168 RepID=B4W224_9CYAN|nr:DUF2079 domain-containing protein [Coleofasciculus chthonoplastes]EDX71665.1 hypothetical protein MC7420_2331 [Coleofasciculus chthonoplastes PCC 7420]
MRFKFSQVSLSKLAITAALAFFCVALILGLHRHYTFYSSYDQGIFNQVFWNNLHGRFFESSLSSQLSTNVVHQGEVPRVDYHRLGQHFTPALLLWLPLYALFPTPATLTVLQVTFVTVAGLVLYVLAREYLEPPLAGMITVSFYCANAVIGPTLSNFHDISQIPLLVFGLLLAMEKRCWWLFWVLAVLLLAVREDAGIGLFGVGVYLILSRRYPRIGLVVCSLSFGYIILLTNLVMPLFSEDISQRFMMERFGQYASGDEASTLEIIWGMVSNPGRVLVELVTPFGRTLNYLLGQWLPLAFVPAISPASWMIAGFPLLKLFLGKGESVLAINIRYAMTVVPGLFYGAILWWSKHQDLYKRSLFRYFWIFCITLTLIFSYTSSASALNRAFYFMLPDSFDPWVHISLPQQWNHVQAMRPLVAQIPPDASVSATTYIIPHLSSRREIIRLPDLRLRNDQQEVINVDYMIADLWRLKQYQVAFDQERGLLKSLVSLIDQVTAKQEYGIIGFEDGVILLQKGVDSNSEAMGKWLVFRKQLVNRLS